MNLREPPTKIPLEPFMSSEVMLLMLESPDPSSSHWGELVVRQLMRAGIDGDDQLISAIAAKGATLEYICAVANRRVQCVTVVARGCAIDGELVLGSAVRENGESFAQPLKELADQVRHQLQLAFL